MKQCATSVNKEQCLQAVQRCTGNPQYDKCVAEEKRLAETSASDRAADAARLDEERRANMRQVR